jgi:hypothetical protein
MEETEILKLIIAYNKPHSVEIKDNAKGEPQVTVKSKNDTDVETAGKKALTEYQRIKKELGV